MLGVFSLLGEVVPLEERLFDAATALSGSGPAFLGLILEAFEDAGIVAGLTHATPGDCSSRRSPARRRCCSADDSRCADLRRMVT